MKRCVAIIAVSLMLLSVLPFSALAMEDKKDHFGLSQRFRVENVHPGDANYDMSVNALDALMIRSYVAGYDAAPASIADIDADGTVGAKDVFYLKAAFAGQISLSQYETDKSVYKCDIAGVDISEYTIVLPEGTAYSDNIYFASELLWKYTEKATGVKLPTVYGECGSAHKICLHYVPAESELGEELGVDGYVYEVKDGDLHIYGGKWGNVYAVYEILEDTLGFFFCENYYTFQYKVRRATLPEGYCRKYVPPVTSRSVDHGYWGSTTYYFSLPRGITPADAPWLVNCHSFCKFQAMGAGVMPEEGTLNPDGTVMSLADRYYAKYDDGFKNGVAYGKVSEQLKMDEHGPQPCATDDDEYNNIFEGLLCYYRLSLALGDPYDKLETVSFSINDNMDYCDCRYCTAKANGTPAKANKSIKASIEKNYSGKYEILEDGRIQFYKETYNGVYLDYLNRAARDIREYYPNLRLSQILYTYGVPETVRPEKNNEFLYCSQIGACFKHHYGDSRDCHGDDRAFDNVHSLWHDEEALPQWIRMCHENDCTVTYWFYPENYTYLMIDLPIYYNLYYNVHWLLEQGIDGLIFQGCNINGADKNFELTKSIISSELFYNPTMTLDEYIAFTKKYLKVRYGNGYEHVFNYLNMWEEASQASDYCCSYWYCTFDVFDRAYIAEHYEEMRNELVLAEEMADIETWYYCRLLRHMCDFLGLSAVYDSWYTNGTPEQRKHYEELYTEWFNWLTENGQTVVTIPDYYNTFKFPTEPDLTQSPSMQIYGREYRLGKH